VALGRTVASEYPPDDCGPCDGVAAAVVAAASFALHRAVAMQVFLHHWFPHPIACLHFPRCPSPKLRGLLTQIPADIPHALSPRGQSPSSVPSQSPLVPIATLFRLPAPPPCDLNTAVERCNIFEVGGNWYLISSPLSYLNTTLVLASLSDSSTAIIHMSSAADQHLQHVAAGGTDAAVWAPSARTLRIACGPLARLLPWLLSIHLCLQPFLAC
jgi:hypothetical protein